MMTDVEALDFVERAMGEPTKGQTLRAAHELGVQPGRLAMWKTRRVVPDDWRLPLFDLANKHGAKLPLTWAIPAALRAPSMIELLYRLGA
jgi:hypothetical protein